MVNNRTLDKTLSKTSLVNTAQPMEIKMFVANNPTDVQDEVNDWLQQNNVFVQHVGQSQSERNGKFVFVISLFYQRA
ncbi:MAG: hypothetical protein C4329_07835 [Chitinophagaceae bacterium]